VAERVDSVALEVHELDGPAVVVERRAGALLHRWQSVVFSARDGRPHRGANGAVTRWGAERSARRAARTAGARPPE